MPTNQHSSQADKVAQQMGYPDAATYLAWQNREKARITSRSATPQQQAPQGVHALLDAAMSWHPAWLLDQVDKKITEATGGGQ